MLDDLKVGQDITVSINILGNEYNGKYYVNLNGWQISTAKYKAEGDYEALSKIPKNASPVRLHNRCSLTGRPKGYMRQFGVSRICFREMALKGLIPGVKKASW